jgi:hypothetical protein
VRYPRSIHRKTLKGFQAQEVFDAFSPEHTTSLTAKAPACYAQLGMPRRSCAWVDRWLKERHAN